ARTELLLRPHAVQPGAALARRHALEAPAHLGTLFGRQLLETLVGAAQPLLLFRRQLPEGAVSLANALLLAIGQLLPVAEAACGLPLLLRRQPVPALRAETQI